MRRFLYVALLFAAIIALPGCATLKMTLSAKASADKHGRVGETVTLERYTATLHRLEAPATIAGLSVVPNMALTTMTPTSNATRPRAGYRWVTFDLTLTDSDKSATILVHTSVKLDDGTTLTPSLTSRQPGLGVLRTAQPVRGWLTFEVPSAATVKYLAISVPGGSGPGPAGEIIFDLD